MHSQSLNLFIVDDDPLMVAGLRNYLAGRFGPDLNISTFHTGASALEKVDDDTRIVILDYFLPGENGNDVLESIKKINPKTEVIMLSSNEDIAIAIDSFRKGATDYIVKGKNAWKKVVAIVLKVVMYPVHLIVKEFRVSKFVAIFLLTFLTVGVVAYLVLKFYY